MTDFIAKTKTVYPNKATFDAIVGPINNFMDNNNGVAEFDPKFSTDDLKPEVSCIIMLRFYDISDETVATRKTQIAGADTLFPVGTTWKTVGTEEIITTG